MRYHQAPMLSLLLLALAAGSADAANLRCTDADKATWLPTATIQQMLREHGFTPTGAITADDGNCYVIQVTDQTGASKTLFLDPTDGALMAME